MQRILFPTDFSTTSLNAFEYALEIAHQLKASITTVHTYSTPPITDQQGMPNLTAEQIIKNTRAEERKEYELFIEQMDKVTSKKKRNHIQVNNRLEYGLVTNQIAEIVQEGNFDLIIMGTNGGDGFGRWLVGTYTSNILNKVDCPVLIIPKDAKYKPIRKIAYATDFASLKEDTIDKVMKWTGKLGYIFHFIHITQEDEALSLEEYDSLEEIIEMSTQYNNVKFTYIRNHNALEKLEAFNKDNQIDTLMMVKHKLSFFQSIFSTSLVKQMVFETETPLLILHE